MSFKCLIFMSALLVIGTVQAGLATFSYADSAIGSTHQNVVRSFGGTVSHYSKAVDTPFSSVRKSDTRINNNVYTPAVYATHSAPAAAVYTSHAAAPTVYTAHAAAPTVYTAHAAAPTVYAANGPAVATVAHYSPAATVAHVTFDGFGAHYVY